MPKATRYTFRLGSSLKSRVVSVTATTREEAADKVRDSFQYDGKLYFVSAHVIERSGTLGDGTMPVLDGFKLPR